MTNYTKSNIFDGKKYKYPITSQETGNTYEVMIHPYGLDDERYLDGCIVSLRRKRFLFSKELYNMFSNQNVFLIFLTMLESKNLKHFFSL